MRPRGAVTVLLAGLLTGGLIASGATPALARPQQHLTARLAPPLVAAGEPAAIVVQTDPVVAGRNVAVQLQVDDGWTTLTTVTTDRSGRATTTLDTAAPGTQTLRAMSSRASSGTVTLTVTAGDDATACTPTTPLVDPAATPQARCLATRLDRWKRAGLMGVGQELNMSSSQYDAPLTALGQRRVAVVGFDLMELDKAKHYDFPFFDQGFASLVALARSGTVLTASWHAANPHTGAPDSYADRSWHDLGALLRDTPEAAAFWAAYDEQLGVLADFQAAGVPIVFRPLHEANGDWFWWGRAAPATYRRLWTAMQRRAWDEGVHNLLWSYGFAAQDRRGISAPGTLLPAAVDLAGIDSYYPSSGGHRTSAATAAPSMGGYAAVARRVPRMTFSEIGPAAVPAGATTTWQPSVITAVARAQERRPLWSMLWVDDGSGRKQIGSLTGGLAWLDGCPNAFCLMSGNSQDS